MNASNSQPGIPASTSRVQERGALNGGVSESRKIICFHAGTFPSPTSRSAPAAAGECPDPDIRSGSVWGACSGVSAIESRGSRCELEDFSYSWVSFFGPFFSGGPESKYIFVLRQIVNYDTVTISESSHFLTKYKSIITTSYKRRSFRPRYTFCCFLLAGQRAFLR